MRATFGFRKPAAAVPYSCREHSAKSADRRFQMGRIGYEKVNREFDRNAKVARVMSTCRVVAAERLAPGLSLIDGARQIP